MTDPSLARRTAIKIYVAVAALVALLVAGFVLWPRASMEEAHAEVRLSVPPFVDTAFTQVGVEKGGFGPLSKRLHLVGTTWENQYQLLAAGGLDISMSTLDEFVNKSTNLRKLGKPIVYILPAWKFRGLGFYATGQVQPVGSQANVADRQRFMKQLAGKKIVLPQGSVFDEALKTFLSGTGVRYEDLSIVNAPLESALNSLSDRSVGIVAVGSQQRFEAERRGYHEAISPEALGLDVITGFVVPEAWYRKHRAEVIAFACGWFRTAQLVTRNPRGAYQTTNRYLVSRGSNSLTFDEYAALTAYDVIPTTPSASAALFMSAAGGANWQRVWGRAVDAMKSTGKAGDAPLDQKGFVAPEIVSAASKQCS
jgi:ABC-type nitrate/sulfonate/bicarbonate transport system substrate-binding protein